MPNKQIKIHKRIQNTMAYLIGNSSKYDNITPILIKLHWLPVNNKIIYLLLTFNCLTVLPLSLPRHLVDQEPARGIRSDDKLELIVAKFLLVPYGDKNSP